MYLGVDYYPEQWPVAMLEEDLARMAGAQINCIRIAEFAWHLMEPNENQFDFSFFQNVLNLADKHGLKVMLGTPTATVPIWLVRKDPDVLSVDEYGVKRHFGGRRQACLNSPTFLTHSDIIVTQMAQAYAAHPAVYAWQIDNELGHETSDWCYCQHCEQAFREYLSEEFKHNIVDFNERLGTIFWCQTYNDFNDIDIPKPTVPAKNPGLMLYFYRFRALAISNYIARQVKILRKYVSPEQIITHNYPGDYYNKAQNFTACAQDLDIVSLNNYPVWGGLDKPVDYAKTALKLEQTRGFIPDKKHFWITEQLIGAQAHTIMGYLPRPGQARLWSWQALLNGCNSLIYFRWRTATKGAEQFCYGVLDHDNQDGPRYFEMQQIFSEAKRYQKLIETPIISKVALLYNPDNIYAWKIQPHSTAMDIQHEHYKMYSGMKLLNVPVDVIDICQPIDEYKIILLPCPLLLTKAQLAKLENFMTNGGTVICGYRAGLKDQDNAIYFNEPNPLLNLARLRSYYIESLGSGVTVDLHDEIYHYTASVWRDILEPLDTDKVETLFSYSDEFANYAAVTKTNIGRGELIYVGSSVDQLEFWANLYQTYLSNHSLDHEYTAYGVEVYKRGASKFVLNHNNVVSNYQDIELKPFEVLILE